MIAQLDVDIHQLWQQYRSNPTVDLRNYLVERYLPLVKYNAERIWARLPGAPTQLGARCGAM